MVALITGLGGERGFGTGYVPPNDDGYSGQIDISAVFENGLQLFGSNFSSLWVNNNGSVTFETGVSQFTPSTITGGTTPGFFAYWGDVDTRGGAVDPTPGGSSAGSNLVWYALDTANDRMVITWDDVGYYAGQTDRLNAFQIIITDLSGEFGFNDGDFSVEYRYEDMQWTTGDASGGSGGLGGTPARAGWTAGDSENYFEMPGSGLQDVLLNWENSPGNTGQAGIWRFFITGDRPEEEQGDRAYELTGATVTEGETFNIVVRRSGDLSIASNVIVQLSPGQSNGATPGSDLPALTSYVVSFEAGQREAILSIETLPDDLDEGTESLLAHLSMIDPGGVGGPDVSLLIRDAAQDDTFGNFELDLAAGDWATNEEVHTGSGLLTIRHVDGPGGVDYLLRINSGSYTIEDGVLTARGASFRFGPDGTDLDAFGNVDFSLDLTSGQITWQTAFGLEYDRPGLHFLVQVNAGGATWARLDPDALVVEHPTLNMVDWLEGVSLPVTLRPNLRFNSEGVSVGGMAEVSAVGPYTINLFDAFSATAAGLRLRYETGAPGDLTDDVLRLQGRFSIEVDGLGSLSVDVGGPADREGLGGDDSRAIVITDENGDGEIETRVGLEVNVEAAESLRMGAFGFDSASLTFDNLDGTLDVGGSAQVRLWNASVGMSMDFTTVGTGAEAHLAVNAASISVSHSVGFHLAHGVFLNSGTLSGDGFTTETIRFTGTAGGYWMDSRLVSFTAGATITSTTRAGGTDLGFRLDGNLAFGTIGDDPLATINGSLALDFARNRAELRGTADFGVAQVGVTVTGTYTERAWSASMVGQGSISVTGAQVRAFLTDAGLPTFGINADSSFGATLAVGALVTKTGGDMDTKAWLAFNTSTVDFTITYGSDSGWDIDLGLTIPQASGARSQSALSAAADGGLVVGQGSKDLVLTASWETPSTTARVEVVMPDGTVVAEDDFAANGIVISELFSTETTRTVFVKSPPAGNWEIRVVDAADLGAVEISGTIRAPRAAVTEMALVADGPTGFDLSFVADLKGASDAVVRVYAVSGTQKVTTLDPSNAVLLQSAELTADGQVSLDLSTAELLQGNWRILTELVVLGGSTVLKDAGQTIVVQAEADLSVRLKQDSLVHLVGEGGVVDLVVRNGGGRSAEDIKLNLAGGAAALVAGVMVDGEIVSLDEFRLVSLGAGRSATVQLVLNEATRAGLDQLIVSAETASAEAVLENNVDRLTLAVRDPLYVLRGGSEADLLEIEDFNGALDGDAGDDTLRGHQQDDLLFGGLGKDDLAGDAGEDLLRGGAGDDQLVGGAGDDTIEGGAGFDMVRFEGRGKSVITLGESGAQATGQGSDILSGVEGLHLGDGADRVQGDRLANLLIGNRGDDSLSGNGGADSLAGGGGNDRLSGGKGQDTVIFGDGGVEVSLALTTGQNTGEGRDRIEGFENLVAGAGDDVLTGNGKVNLIEGGAGRDRMTGGSGKDVFVFRTGTDSGQGARADVITDFTSGKDRIDLSALDVNGAEPGDGAFVWGDGAPVAFGIWQTRAGRDTVLNVDLTGDGVSDFGIRLKSVGLVTEQDVIL